MIHFQIFAFKFLFKTIFIATLVTISLTSVDAKSASTVERCLKTPNHLSTPAPVPQLLHELCSAWSLNACCTPETAAMAHQRLNHLAFDIDHCGFDAISHECHVEFIRELCYYSCDPYIGPWIVGSQHSFPYERFMLVPLCASECNRWWNACRDSLTCVRNWRKHFVPKLNSTLNVTVNMCPEHAAETDHLKCQPIKQIFSDGVDFCETIWDQSWRVVPDSEKCIRLKFSPDKPNPNKAVAEYHWQIESRSRPIEDSTMGIILFFGFWSVFGLIVIYCLSCLFKRMRKC